MTEADQASTIRTIIEAYPADRRYALAAMQDMQRRFNYIPEEGLTALSERLGCPKAQLYAMATFYKALSLKPKGEHIIKICNGTACHLRGSTNDQSRNRAQARSGHRPRRDHRRRGVLRRVRQLPGILCAGTRHGGGRHLLQQTAGRADSRHTGDLPCGKA